MGICNNIMPHFSRHVNKPSSDFPEKTGCRNGLCTRAQKGVLKTTGNIEIYKTHVRMLSCALPFVTIFLHSYSPEYARNLLPNTLFLPVFHYHSCRRCREGVIYECEVIFYARSVFIRCNQLPERHCAISFYPDILRRRQRKERLDTETGSGRKAHPFDYLPPDHSGCPGEKVRC